MGNERGDGRRELLLSIAAMGAGAIVFFACSTPAVAPPPPVVASPVAETRPAPAADPEPAPQPAADSNSNVDSDVQLGLRWLAARQSAAGRWGDPATTGLVLLAFTGAGHTTRNGIYGDVVKKAVRALVDGQRPDGGLAPTLREHAMAGLALTEIYGMTESRAWKAPAQRAADFAQMTRTKGGGWVFPGSDALDIETTAWMSCLLLSAKLSGLEADAAAPGEIAAAFERITDPATGRITVPASQRGRISDDAATAIGLLVRIRAGGDRKTDPLLAKAVAAVASNSPAATSTDLLYRQFGVWAMLQVGAEGWKPWSARFTAFAQMPPDTSGSWPPREGVSDEDDRIVTTVYHLLACECFYGPVGHLGGRK